MATFWKDIDNSFEKKNNGDLKDNINEEAVSNSLSNIFQTLQGARRMLPEFALPIYRLLFEPMTELIASRLAEMIWEAVEQWDSRVVVEGVTMTIVEDRGYYEVNLNYYIGSAGNENNLQNFTDIIRAR